MDEKRVTFDLTKHAINQIDGIIKRGISVVPEGYEAAYAFGVASTVFQHSFEYLESISPAYKKLPFVLQLAVIIRITMDALGQSIDSRTLPPNITEGKVIDAAYREVLEELGKGV